MIAPRHPVSEGFEPLQASGAEAAWVGRDSSANQDVVRGKRILLVDDEKLVRTALRMMLEVDGHQVTEASNGAEAVNLFNIGEFDLVITDFEMPIMKGNELAIRIKLLAPSLPILMITASEWAHGDVKNPVDALLNKPLTMPELRGALGKLLSARPDSADVISSPASSHGT
jgi:CheY-like chemotaxis protein